MTWLNFGMLGPLFGNMHELSSNSSATYLVYKAMVKEDSESVGRGCALDCMEHRTKLTNLCILTARLIKLSILLTW